MSDDQPFEVEKSGDESDQPQEAEGQGSDPKPKKKRVRKTTSDIWEHFHQGDPRPDGSYDAICKYCKQKFLMGNQKSNASMKYHKKKGCKKIPSAKRQKTDASQKLLKGTIHFFLKFITVFCICRWTW